MADNENYVIRVKRGTADEWAVYNPILGAGELGYDTTNRRLKVGDGLNVWSNIKFATGNSFDVARDAGFDGSLQEWIASLKGEPGTPGGPRGPQGEVGPRDPTGELSTKIVRNSVTDVVRTTLSEAEVLKVIDQSTTDYSDTFRFEDTPEHNGNIINIHHYSTASTTPQSYGINIANHDGAASAFIIHQYSSKSPAIQIDNTDISTSILIKNTQNQTQNPGGSGTGAFLQFMPFGQSKSLFFNDSLQWINFTDKDMLFRAIDPNIYALGVQVDTDKTGLQIMKNSLGPGSAMAITNKGTGPGISIVQHGNSPAVKYVQLFADSYVTRTEGIKYGSSTAISGDGGIAYDISKTGTGSGILLRLLNRGTGNSMSITDGTTTTFQIKPNGETEIGTAGIGLVLRSSNGTRYRVYVLDDGTVNSIPA